MSTVQTQPDEGMPEENSEKSGEVTPKRSKRRAFKIAGYVALGIAAALLVIVLALNLTITIKGSVNQDVPPDLFGTAPMAVTTDSMEGEEEDSFGEGALIFVRLLDDEGRQQLEAWDIVTYRHEKTFVTHRIIGVNRVDGKIVSVTTKGDNRTDSDGAIPIENVIGRYTGKMEGIGSFVMFLQSPTGIIVCIGVPIALFIVIDTLRITLYNRKVRARIKAEEAARAEQTAQDGDGQEKTDNE